MEGICRGCLMSYDDITELLQYTERTERLFMYSTGIRLRSVDRDMFKLCKGCFLNMRQSCKFKKQCRTSEKKFKHYLSLKEIGDTYDLTTFFKNNEEIIRFPSLSGNSTPANHKVKDEDNESTCTSMRNFMTDLLQGAEVPEAEEHIIREVIEEEASVLDDTLDSLYLQDDASVENISRLDLSFSPFSTSYSVSNDHCNIPLKENESDSHNATNHKLTSKDINNIQNQFIDHESENLMIASNSELHQAVISIKNIESESHNLFNNQAMKYVENENNLVKQSLLQTDMNQESDSVMIASNRELEQAVISIKNIEEKSQNLFDDQHNSYATQSENNIVVNSLLQSSMKQENDSIILASDSELEQAVISINKNEEKSEILFDDQDNKYITENENNIAVKSLLQSNMKEESDSVINTSNSELSQAVMSIQNIESKSENLFDNQNINYITKNNYSNNIAGGKLLQPNDGQNNINSKSIYAMQPFLNNKCNQETTEQLLSSVEISQESNFDNEYLRLIMRHKEMCEVKNDKMQNKLCQFDTQDSANNLKNRIIINIQPGKEISINGNQVVETWNKNYDSLTETNIVNRKGHNDEHNINLNHTNSKSDSGDVFKNLIQNNILSQNNNKYTIAIDYKNIKEKKDNNTFEEALQAVDGDKISLSDLLDSPAGYVPVQGASTPMINNILFGDNLEMDTDTKASKCSDENNKDGVNVLDEILNEGIKEFDMDIENVNGVMYDLLKFICKTCNKQLKTLTALKKHLAWVHNIRLPHDKKRSFDKKSRICPDCGKVFQHFSGYNMHMRKHKIQQDEKVCSVCKLTFCSDKKLELHMKSHTGIRSVMKKENSQKYICTICGAGFSVSGNFSIHMRRHVKNYAYKCEECDKGYYRKTDYDDHMRIHTGERPFLCQYCDKSFRRKFALIRHVKVHLDDKNFECDYCSQRFIFRRDLVHHIKNSTLCLKLRAGLKPVPTRRPVGRTYECGYCHQILKSQKKLVSHQKNFMPCRTFHADPTLRPLLDSLEANENVRLVSDAEDDDVEIMED